MPGEAAVSVPREASYLHLLATGELDERAAALTRLETACALCPRSCGLDRRVTTGPCGSGTRPLVASWGPHLGEESPISGRRGSGTVFLAGCNLHCLHCQNADISQPAGGPARFATDDESLAAIMLELQLRGCHNINWVSPTHQLAELVRALAIAARQGLSVPIVHNGNGYDSVAALRLLDGIVDIYMPDLKYADAATGELLSGVTDYPGRARAALAEMRRQVGADWETGADGVLERGLLVRLLILPAGLAGVTESLRWLAEVLGPDVAVSLLSQYRPAHRAAECRPLARPVATDDFRAAVSALARWNSSRHTLVQPFAALAGDR